MSTIPKISTPEVADITASIEKAWTEEVLRRSGARSNHANVYASQYSPCVRQMVLGMTASDQLPAFSADQLARMNRGNDRERDLLIELSRVGQRCEHPFLVQAQQERFELRGRNGKVCITGKVDARLKFSWGAPPAECKAWSPLLTEKIHEFEDVFRNPWTRRGGFQLLAYLLGANEPLGFLILDRAGLPRLISVELYPNLERIERFLTDAQNAMEHKANGTLPDFIQDAAECKRCDFFGGACQPPIGGEGARVLTDPELIAKIERWSELELLGDEFETLDKELKESLRGVESGIAGEFIVSGSWQPNTLYKVPKDVKAQYREVVNKGKFTLSIVRL